MRILGLQRQQEKSVQLLFCLAALLFFKKLSFWSVEIQASVQKTRGQRWKRVLSFKIKFGRIRTFSHLIFSTYLKTFMIWFFSSDEIKKTFHSWAISTSKTTPKYQQFLQLRNKTSGSWYSHEGKEEYIYIYIYVNLANPQPFKQHYLLQTMAIAEY